MISLVAALLLASAAPEPPPAAAASPPAATPKKVKSDELVCWDETPTGTRFSHKVCATRDQVEQRRQNDQDWKMRQRPMPPAGN